MTKPNLDAMTIEELQAHVAHLKHVHMLADHMARDWDGATVRAAWDEYRNAERILEARQEPEKGILELAADFKQMCDELVAGTNAA